MVARIVRGKEKVDLIKEDAADYKYLNFALPDLSLPGLRTVSVAVVGCRFTDRLFLS